MQSNLAILALGLIFAGCMSGKTEQASAPNDTSSETTTSSNSDEGGMVQMQLNYTGTVRDMSKEEGCGWMIELDMGNGEIQLLEPLELDPEYQVDGKLIQFAYTDSRRPSQCTVASKPITIDKIIK